MTTITHSTRYHEANLFHRAMRQLAATRPMSWLYSHTLHHIDRATVRATGGRTTFAALVSGLPVVMLETIGAKSLQPRRVPVLGLPYGSSLVIVASNFGQRRHPSWYYNLRKNQTASVIIDNETSTMTARQATPTEEIELWSLAESIYPGWSHYRRRASHRHIGLFILDPATLPTDDNQC